MSKDYYKILGVEKSASPDEIKKAFRKLAHQYHPDKKGGDEAKFKEVNEAYQVVGDAQKRQKYDQFGSDFDQQGGFGGGAGWEDFMRQARGQGGFGGSGQGFEFNFGDLFGDAFGFGGGGRGGGRQRRGNDVQVDLEISFHDAAFGVEREIRLTKNNACDVCTGSGVEPGSKMNQCATCKGQGRIQQSQRTIFGTVQALVACQSCHGAGQIPEKKCKHCGGDGIVKSDSKLNVKIPAGIDNGETIRLTGHGESAGKLGAAGDLYITVHVKADPRFERDGFEIYTDLTVSYPQAVLGDTVEIDTLDGKKKIVVPEGTQSHQQIRLKGLGVTRLHGGGRGDQYVRVIVDVPKKVSKNSRKLIEELKNELK